MDKRDKLIVISLLAIAGILVFKNYKDSYRPEEPTYVAKEHDKYEHTKVFLDGIRDGFDNDVSVELIEKDKTGRFVVTVKSNSSMYINIEALENYVSRSINEDECIKDILVFGNDIEVYSKDITGKDLELKGYSDRANTRNRENFKDKYKNK